MTRSFPDHRALYTNRMLRRSRVLSNCIIVKHMYIHIYTYTCKIKAFVWKIIKKKSIWFQYNTKKLLIKKKTLATLHERLYYYFHLAQHLIRFLILTNRIVWCLNTLSSWRILIQYWYLLVSIQTIQDSLCSLRYYILSYMFKLVKKIRSPSFLVQITLGICITNEGLEESPSQKYLH